MDSLMEPGLLKSTDSGRNRPALEGSTSFIKTSARREVAATRQPFSNNFLTRCNPSPWEAPVIYHTFEGFIKFHFKLFAYIADHFVDDEPATLQFMKGQKLLVVEIIHFYFYLCHPNGVNQFDGQDFSLEWFARILWALPVFDSIEILFQCFDIRLAFHVAEKQGAFIINLVQKIQVALINSLEIKVFKYSCNRYTVGVIVFHFLYGL